MNTSVEIITLQNELDAEAVYQFLVSPNAFTLPMTEFRKNSRKNAVFGSLKNAHSRYWFAKVGETVIGAIGMCENERENGGYYIDYFAVHTDFRRQGIGQQLIQQAEAFARELQGRYILIDTGGDDGFEAARKFYESQGYRQVGYIPEYYDVGEDRVDYYKSLKTI